MFGSIQKSPKAIHKNLKISYKIYTKNFRKGLDKPMKLLYDLADSRQQTADSRQQTADSRQWHN